MMQWEGGTLRRVKLSDCELGGSDDYKFKNKRVREREKERNRERERERERE